MHEEVSLKEESFAAVNKPDEIMTSIKEVKEENEENESI